MMRELEDPFDLRIIKKYAATIFETKFIYSLCYIWNITKLGIEFNFYRSDRVCLYGNEFRKFK